MAHLPRKQSAPRSARPFISAFLYADHNPSKAAAAPWHGGMAACRQEAACRASSLSGVASSGQAQRRKYRRPRSLKREKREVAKSCLRTSSARRRAAPSPPASASRAPSSAIEIMASGMVEAKPDNLGRRRNHRPAMPRSISRHHQASIPAAHHVCCQAYSAVATVNA